MKPANFVGCAPSQTADFLNDIIAPLLKSNKGALGISAEITV
jgi:adenylosuccinate lyase